ncbi:hypothetical protein J0A68_18320 [Algoriphagus sp. H41]|uniref:SGNH/GDSL hydrolase family protein n=1 Tax=Algoriphagus oliviformis TaxID=2811231 RepID=A0ABS3C722_9BACT|nr:hypothetical protein [Algoriphagus oliviformis]MBN7812918.1 hypothetical protein [Algoriphagus oliviformis]
MRKFTVRLSWFVFPVLVFLSVPAYVFWKTGESFLSESQFREAVGSGDFLIGYLYNESNYRALKKAAVESRPAAEVMVLGSSRTTQFRDFMFDAPFYNSGYTIVTINQFQEYLESMPAEKLPKVLVVGLDQWMFNPHWDQADAMYETDYFDPQSVRISETPKPQQIEAFWRDWLSGSYALKKSELASGADFQTVIGLNGNYFAMGFRDDGSFYYGAKVAGLLRGDSTIQDFGFRDTFERIDRGVARFEYGSELNAKAMQKLDELVTFCEDKGIKLIAFLPPFAPSVAKRLSDSGKHDYLWMLPGQLDKALSGTGAELWDFTDVQSLGIGDDAFLDGFHGSEYCYLKMVANMVERHSVLERYVDLDRIEKLAAQPKNTLEIR